MVSFLQEEKADLERETIQTNFLLSPQEFELKLNSLANVQLIDIRTIEELAENGSIDGALNIDFYKDNFEVEINKLNKDLPVMLYCRSGGRSGEATQKLVAWGFTQVYDLSGGYNAWLTK